MANCIVKHIPNSITCCNLICGCMATGAAFHGNYDWAILMILCGALFDFFDGMVARLLGVSSPIGKELDSLADVVTFGVAPSAMLFHLFTEVQYPAEWMQMLRPYLPYTAFLVAAFSALRLAKFNLDERQTSSFIGLPTPANALFWCSLIAGARPFLGSEKFHAIYLFCFMLVFCFLLVAEIPLFALKFKNLSWADNKVRFIFLLGCLPLLAFTGYSCLALIVVWYILLSLVSFKWR